MASVPWTFSLENKGSGSLRRVLHTSEVLEELFLRLISILTFMVLTVWLMDFLIPVLMQRLLIYAPFALGIAGSGLTASERYRRGVSYMAIAAFLGFFVLVLRWGISNV